MQVFFNNFVNEKNIPRRGPVPKFSDLEVVALSLAAESESIDSKNWLFEPKFKEYKGKIPNLISRRQFNDRRQIAMVIDGRSVIREYGNPPNNRKRSAHGSVTMRNTDSPFDEIKYRHTLNEIGDVAEDRYDWKINRERGGISM